VIVDAGPLVALFDPSERQHAWAKARFQNLHGSFFTCEPVLVEASYLLARVKHGREALFNAWSRGSMSVSFEAEKHKVEVIRMVQHYRDVPMSLADACLVRMSELLPQAKVMTLDPDFRVYRRFGRRVIPLIAPWQT
jgi:predicted nucleic acid-binding protein